MKRKAVSFTLALAMTLGMAVNAAAAERLMTISGSNPTGEIPVTGKYIQQLDSAEVISVNVKWDAMNFTYAGAFQGTWNPTDHSYTEDTEHEASGDWLSNTANIDITNHSNVDVTVSYAFEPKEDSNVTGRFYGASDSAKESVTSNVLNKGEEDKSDQADSTVIVFEIGGALDMSASDGKQLGTITVSVEKREETAVTYTLSTEAKSIYYWNQNGTAEKGDPDWTKVEFIVTGTDGSTKTLAYSNVTVTPLFEGKMDLSMKPAEEEQIWRTYSYQAVAASAVAGSQEDLTCIFTVIVCNNSILLPSSAGDMLYL